MEKRKLTKAQETQLLEIAKKNLYAVEERGDLETRNWDGADFFEVSVWELKKALEEAYLLGKGK